MNFQLCIQENVLEYLRRKRKEKNLKSIGNFYSIVFVVFYFEVLIIVFFRRGVKTSCKCDKDKEVEVFKRPNSLPLSNIYTRNPIGKTSKHLNKRLNAQLETDQEENYKLKKNKTPTDETCSFTRSGRIRNIKEMNSNSPTTPINSQEPNCKHPIDDEEDNINTDVFNILSDDINFDESITSQQFIDLLNAKQ